MDHASGGEASGRATNRRAILRDRGGISEKSYWCTISEAIMEPYQTKGVERAIGVKSHYSVCLLEAISNQRRAKRAIGANSHYSVLNSYNKVCNSCNGFWVDARW